MIWRIRYCLKATFLTQPRKIIHVFHRFKLKPQPYISRDIKQSYIENNFKYEGVKLIRNT